MTDRNRPPKDVRLGTQLAQAVVSGRQAEAHDLAKKLLARQETERQRIEERRRGVR